MPHRTRSSLQFQMPVAAALLLGLVAATLTWLAAREVRKLAIDANGARLEAAVERLVNSTALGVERMTNVVTELATAPQVIGYLQDQGADTAALHDLLARGLGNDNNVTVILWNLAAEPVLFGAARGDTAGWVGPPVLVDDPTITNIEFVNDSLLAYDIIGPVRSGGRLIGFVQRRAHVGGSSSGTDAAAALLGDSGQLLFGSRGGPWTNLDGIVTEPAYASIDSEHPVRYFRDGVERLGIGRSLPGSRWVLVAEIPVSVAIAATRGFVGRLGALAAVLVILASLAAWLLGSRITRPLDDLRRTALAMRRGDSAMRAPVRGHPEIAAVSSEFNRMADSTSAHLQAVEASEQRLRSLVTASAQVVFWATPDGDVRDPLPGWQAFTGQTSDEAMGKGWLDAVHPDDRARAMQTWHEAVAHRSLYETEYRVRRHDGEYRWCLVRGVPVLQRDGKVSEWVGTYTDITDRRRVEEALQRREDELRQAQRLDAIGRLAGGVAHDFNNLLTAIVVPAELAIEKLPQGHPVREELDEIREAGNRASELTRQLLAFGRQQVLAPEVLQLDEVVTAASRILRRVIPESVVLNLSLHGKGGLVRVDRTQLEQVIINLAVNARDAMPKGGRLTIETAPVTLTEEFCQRHQGVAPGRYVMLAMTDTGQGMDQATLSQVFEPFFTTKEQGKGTGLGLSTVYGIVRQSGGHIWIYSEPGKGTVVKVYFPEQVADSVRGTMPAESAGPVPSGTGDILFAEDDPALRRIGVRVLAGLGYTVHAAENGESALRLAETLPHIDLLVTDVVMPGIDGVELWERLRKLRPGIKVLFLSGWASDAVVRHRILEGEVPFVQKPFTAETLGRKVFELMKR